MKNLFKNSLYSFHLLDELLTVEFFNWTEKTKEMSYEDFQAACNNYAGFAWQYQSKRLLVDTCHFYFQLPETFGVWREEQLNSRYYGLGVQKFAYITTPELIQYMKDIPTEKGKFETRNFVTQQEVLD